METAAGLSWHALVKALAKCKTDKEAHALLEAEVKGDARPAWLQRAYHRFSTLRRRREMQELGLED